MRSLKQMVRASAPLALGLVAMAGAGLGLASGAAAQEDAVGAYSMITDAPDDAWRTLDPEDTLYMDLPSGRIVIELRPDFAPNHVQRIKELTRRGFYDGTIFHRVIEGFMAQGGDPSGTGRGGSQLPNLQGEFIKDANDIGNFTEIGRDRRVSRIGFVGPLPVGTQPETLPNFLNASGVALWGMHCQGVMSMARASDPNSANSQFFLMFGDSRGSLDQGYTVWGRIVDGYENARRINRGEPPARPTPINRMRVASDVPAEERSEIQVLRTDTQLFENYLRAAGYVSAEGYIDNVCAIGIPKKIDGEVEF